MRLLSIVARLANEHEREIRSRLIRARNLFTGKDCDRDYLDTGAIQLTGRVFVVTTWRIGKGETDFLLVLNRDGIKPTKIIRLNWLEHGGSALAQAISANIASFGPGDILAIVRGGGDTTDRQFDPFRNRGACEQIRRLTQEIGVVVVTGIGHATDHFLVEEVASFKQATPTDAAYKIRALLKV